jgi:outer membrane cobalamin receptor
MAQQKVTGGAQTATLDSIHRLHEVVVTANRFVKEVIPVQSLEGKQLQRLSVHSVADALRYFAGVQIKDYGGIGGLKTVNIRSHRVRIMSACSTTASSWAMHRTALSTWGVSL